MASRLPSEWRNVDYYAELGVVKDATFDDVSRRYRALAKQLHPDLHPGDPDASARFARVSAAHEVLADPVRRHDYDVYRRSLLGDAGPREPRLRGAPEPSRPMGTYRRPPAAPPRPTGRPAPRPRARRERSGFVGQFASEHPFAFALIVVFSVILLASLLSGAARRSNGYQGSRSPATTFDSGNQPSSSSSP